MQTNGEWMYGKSRSCESVICGVMKSIDFGLPASTRDPRSSLAADPWLKHLGYSWAPSRAAPAASTTRPTQSSLHKPIRRIL